MTRPRSPRLPPSSLLLPALLGIAGSLAPSPAGALPPLVPPGVLEGTPLASDGLEASAASEVEGSPLTLPEALATALAASPDLGEAVLGPVIGEAILDERRGVYAPSLTLEGSSERHVVPAASALAGATELDERTTTFGARLSQPVSVTGGEVSVGLTNAISETNSSFASLSPEYTPVLALEVRQPLLRNLLTDAARTEIQIATLDRDAALVELRQRTRAIVADAERRYWDLAAAAHQVRIARLTSELATRLLENNQRRFELGALARPDVLEVEAALAEAEDSLVAARLTFRDASEALKRTLGLPSGGPSLLPADDPQLATPASLAELLAHAVQHREDVLLATLDVERLQERVRLARFDRLPDIDLTGGVGLNGLAGNARVVRFGSGEPVVSPFDGNLGDAYDELGSGDYFDWRVGLAVRIPLGEDDRAARFDRTRLEERRAEASLARLVADATTAVERAHDRWRTAEARVATTGRIVDRSLESLRAEARRLSLGASRTDDVIRKLDTYAGALTRQSRAFYDRAIALADLEAAAATNLERRGIQTTGPEPLEPGAVAAGADIARPSSTGLGVTGATPASEDVPATAP